MKNNRIKAYCVLLSAIIFAGTLGISVGEAEARYGNSIFCNTVIEVPEAKITSDVLFDNSEAPVTVFLGETAKEKNFSFRIKTSGSAAKEKLSWSVSSDDVTVEFGIGEQIIESGTEIEIEKDSETEINVKIVSKYDSHPAFTAEIQVSFGAELEGNFSIDFLETAEAGDSSEGLGSSEIPPETSPEDEGGSDNSETEAPTVDSGSETNGLKSVSRIKPDGKLPIKMNLPDGTTFVRIGIFENEEISDLPEGTKISTDEGGNYYMIFGGGIAEFKMSKFLITESGYSLLLDFEKAELGEREEIIIAVEAFSDSGKLGDYKISVKTDVYEAGNIRKASSVQDIGIAENDNPQGGSPLLLSKGDWVEAEFPKEWAGEAALKCSVQILSISGDGKPVFVNADENLEQSYTVDDFCVLAIKPGKMLPAAGTYQAYIRWEFEGICFYKEHITFFVNYSSSTYSTFES